MDYKKIVEVIRLSYLSDAPYVKKVADIKENKKNEIIKNYKLEENEEIYLLFSKKENELLITSNKIYMKKGFNFESILWSEFKERDINVLDKNIEIGKEIIIELSGIDVKLYVLMFKDLQKRIIKSDDLEIDEEKLDEEIKYLEKKNNKNIMITGIIVIIVFIVLGLLTMKITDTSPSAGIAKNRVKMDIQRKLKDPESLEIEKIETIKYLNDTYEVTGVFRAKNSFGAKVMSTFKYKVKFVKDENGWHNYFTESTIE